ncbi:S-adenosyl-L-methionine-dependent methyltransferase [Mycena olivaceomarginata]|nr:S-adenosyl-L-methionine-dependent methyltransferase [Mycena olivaceomarginata]
MATFAKSSYDSGSYAASRPTYPRLLYDVVMRFHSEGQHNEGSDRWHRAVDLGQATIELLAKDDRPGFQSVIALDPSSNMVQVAQESIPEPFKSLVEFRQSTAEDLSFIQDGTVDMVTAAQSAHWFDWNQVWPELQRVLKPGGTFAFWGYSEFRLAQHPELTPLITAYSQGTDPATSLGPHWEPKRKILDNHFLDVAAPATGWADLTRDVILRKRMTWGGGLANYLSTYSSLHRYHDRFPADRERADGDIATRFRRTLMEATASVEVEWPLALVVVRKIY